MNFFKSWSFSQKLLAVNASYIIPCFVLGYFLTLDQTEKVNFSLREKLGVEFQRPLEIMLSSAGELKVLHYKKSHDEAELKDEMETVSSQIDSALTNLESFPRADFERLKYNPATLAALKIERASEESLKSEWQTLTTQHQSATLEVNEERLDHFIASLRMAITYIGDASNLSVDPRLDSKYLADAVLIGLPQAEDRLQQLVSYIVSLGEGDQWTEANRVKVQVLVSLLKNDVDFAVQGVQNALREDKLYDGVSESLQKEIPQRLKTFNTTFQTLLRDTAKASQTTTPAEASEALKDLLESGEKAMEVNFEFWNALSSELEGLLTLRAAHERQENINDIILAIMAWLPIVFIASITVRRLSMTFILYASKLESEAALANNSSVELAAASQTVSSGSTEQAAAIQETGASMSEITSMVSRSSGQAVSSQDLARKVKDQTDEGCQVIERLVLSMQSIQEANAQLQNISSIISAISEKTNIINDIVGKTQLLSFNASIEAARAGQHGRGFAVVAEEVGNLAQTSGNAAKEIRSLIDDSRQQVDSILKNTVARVSEGRSVTGQAQEIFTKIAKDISTISSQIESISEASREQQFGIEQIAKAMTQMDQGTQLNNSAAFSAARLSDQLLNQSRKLTGIARTIGELVSGRRAKSSESSSDGSDQDDNSSHEHQAKTKPTRHPLNIKRNSSHANHNAEPYQQMDSVTIERTVSNLAKKESELDHVTSLKSATNDANDASFKKVA